MQVKRIERSPSSIGWCPVSKQVTLGRRGNYHLNSTHLLASGKHQALDDSFDSKSHLEILDSSLSHGGLRMPSLGKFQSSVCFTSLSWGLQGSNNESTPLGIIAGGMEDGTVTLWNPYSIINDENNNKSNNPEMPQKIHSVSQHTRNITHLQFNPNPGKFSKYLATAATDSQLLIWDLSKPTNPVCQPPPGQQQQQQSFPPYMQALAWNVSVPYILAASNVIGETQIYDLKNKRLALKFKTKSHVSVTGVAWNPKQARQLAVCYANNVAEIWDLRQPMYPKQYLENAHRRSILDIAWCPHDSNMLLTSGEDHKGVMWSTKGEPLHEIDFGTPNFEINWSPLRAGSLACSSLDGRISTYNINDAGPKYCPSYLGRDCGVSFGFGGKLIKFGKMLTNSESPSGSVGLTGAGGTTPRAPDSVRKKNKSKVYPAIDIDYLVKEPKMIERAQTFQKILNSLRDTTGSMKFAENKIRDLEHITENKESMESFNKDDETNELNKDRLTWNLARLMYDYNPQNQNRNENEFDEYKEAMLNFLGYDRQEVESALMNEQNGGAPDESMKDGMESSAVLSRGDAILEHDKAQEKAAIVASGDGSQDMNNLMEDESEEDVDDFFGNLKQGGTNHSGRRSSKNKQDEMDDMMDANDSGAFGLEKPLGLSRQTTDPAQQAGNDNDNDNDNENEMDTKVTTKDKSKELKKEIENKYDVESELDRDVKHALVTKDYKSAMNLSLNAGNIADALVFAYYGGSDLWEYAKKAYFTQHRQEFVATTFKYIANSSFDDLVEKSDLRKWKETLAILITYTADREFNDLCNKLGSRLMAKSGENNEFDYGATVCFMCCVNVEQLIELWTMSLSDAKKATDSVLYNCIIKALTYINSPYVAANYKFCLNRNQVTSLSGIFCKYANLLANVGSLDIAQNFLTFVQQFQTPVGSLKNNEIDRLQQRISISQRSGISNVRPQTQAPLQQLQQGHTPQGPQSGRRPLADNRRVSDVSSVGSGTPTNQPRVGKPVRPTQRFGGSGFRPSNNNGATQSGTSTPTSSQGPGQGPRSQGLTSRVPTASPATNVVPPGPGHSTMRPTRPDRARMSQSHRQTPQRTTSGGFPQSQQGLAPATQQQQQSRTQHTTPTRSLPGQQGSSMAAPAHGQGQAVSQMGMGRSNNGGAAMPSRRGPSHGSVSNVSTMAQPRTPIQGQHHQQQTSSLPPQQQLQQLPQMQQMQQNSGMQARQGPGPQLQGQNMQQNNVGQRVAPSHMAPRVPQGSNMGHMGQMGQPIQAMGQGMGQQGMGQQGMGQQAMAPHQQQFHQGQRQQQQMQPPAHPIGKTTMGTGFFGETSMDDLNKNNEPLPDDASMIVGNIENYIDGLLNDGDISQLFTSNEVKQISNAKAKLSGLANMIENNTLSYYAYSMATEMFNALQSRQYDVGNKKYGELVKNTSEFRKCRAWVMGFKILLGLAAKYKI